MAYATSSCASITALVTFIRNTATANGWTLSGQVLHKGACYVRVWDVDGTNVGIQGGTGIDGSNNLTGACATAAYLGTIAGIAIAYPLTAEMHINTSPDEVFVVINYATSYYSLMAWGLSDVPGLTGTGVWYHANRTGGQGFREYHTSLAGIDIVSNFGAHVDGTPLFMAYGTTEAGGTNNSFIHHDVDGGGWTDYSAGNWPSSFRYVYPLNAYQPNAWNGETVLLPYPVYMARTSGNKQTLVADFKHIRHCRIDYHQPGEIITLGPDDWKIYPWFNKSTVNRDGGASLNHSGTLAYALRYTGP
jgi:hypothetical protein